MLFYTCNICYTFDDFNINEGAGVLTERRQKYNVPVDNIV
jgi:hypothetical protein